MKTGRSISMDSAVWTEIGEVSDNETEGDVSAAIERLCREALEIRNRNNDEARGGLNQ